MGLTRSPTNANVRVALAARLVSIPGPARMKVLTPDIDIPHLLAELVEALCAHALFDTAG